MIRFSTGLRNALAVEFGLGVMMNGGVIRVYGGFMPATPDLAPGTPLLGTITTDGKPFTPITDPEEAGLILSFLEPGGLINFGDWRLKGSATGTATWFRWHWKWEDDLGDSSFYPRIDGDIGTTSSLSALRLTSTGITASTDRQIEQFAMVLPMEGV